MSDRKIYVKNDVISLAECLPEDYRDLYDGWLDEEVQRGYNHRFNQTFEEYVKQNSEREKSNLVSNCAVILNGNNKLIGSVGVAMFPDAPNDMSIRIFKPYRSQGYGSMAFMLGVKYCFDVLNLDKIYAGSYPDNIRSIKMIEKCGFIPNPEGNINEEHYITGEPVTQLDFILTKEKYKNNSED